MYQRTLVVILLCTGSSLAFAASRVDKPVAIAVPDEQPSAFGHHTTMSWSADALSVWYGRATLRIADIRAGGVRAIPMPTIWPPGVQAPRTIPRSGPNYSIQAISAANGLVLLRLAVTGEELTDTQVFCIWRVQDGSLLPLTLEATDNFYRAKFSPAGDLLVMWGEKLVFDPKFTPGRGRRVVVAKREAMIKVWRLPAPQPAHELLGHETEIHINQFNSNAISPNGSRLASAGSRRRSPNIKRLEMFIWNLQRGTLEEELYGKENQPTGATAFSVMPTNGWRATQTFFIGGSDLIAFTVLHGGTRGSDRLEIWSIDKQKRVLDAPGFAVGAASRTKPLYLASGDGEVQLWDASKNQKLAWLPELNPALHRRVRLSEQGRAPVGLADDGTMIVTLSRNEDMGKVLTWWPADSWKTE